MADDTIVVFTSDHGDLLGAHGGLMQKWYNAYDEAIRVPLLVRGPRRRRRAPAASTVRPATSTSSPRCSAWPASTWSAPPPAWRPHHDEAQPAAGPGPERGLIRARPPPASVAAPLYFMTEDDVTPGPHARRTSSPAQPFEPVPHPVAHRVRDRHAADGRRRREELWKLNHYYERLDEFDEAHGLATNPFAAPPAEPA